VRVKMRLEGFEEARAMLRSLPEAVSDTVLVSALKEAADPLVVDLVQSAPRSYAAGPLGHAADSIKAWTVDRELRGGHIAVAPADWAFYLRFREFGTVHQQPEPFFRVTVMRHIDGIEARFAEIVWSKVNAKLRSMARKTKAAA
jgi:HK97 gp10 family phage protein